MVGLAATALVGATTVVAVAADPGHGAGRMGPRVARTTSVDPAAGPDFEMPFVCGQRWTGTSRSTHSPSSHTIDFNSPNDLGKPALASAPGVVTKAVTLKGSYGRYVVIDHGRGYSTLYAHLHRIAAVVGQVVDQGDLIGYVGGSGHVTGPHLHFEERLNGAYFPPYFHRTRFRMGSTGGSGSCNDRPVTGDWNGDGVTDLGVFRATSSVGVFYQRTSAGTRSLTWGAGADRPVVGDYDGDRVAQVGVRRRAAGSWVLRARSGAAASVTGVGYSTDQPVTGDWDGNSRADLGVYRPSSHTFYLRSDRGAYTAVRWGASGDQPVVGDWNGDGATDLGVFNPASRVWTLRVPSGHAFVPTRVTWASVGDIPVVGDWNGDGTSDLGLWRPSTAHFYQRVPSGASTVTRSVWFGSSRR